jgi:hypothetical protein
MVTEPVAAGGRARSWRLRAARWAARVRRERLTAYALLLLAVAFNLYGLYPEVAIRAPMLNDGVLHLLAAQRAADTLAAGQDPTDTWLGPIALGFPLFHSYQHLAYLPPAALYVLSRGALSIADIYHWITYLLLSCFPLSIYWSLRRFGFDRLTAALAGLAAPLVATQGLYGLEYGSYVWRGYGLYTQLWGMLLMPPALAQGYAVLRDGRGYFWAVLLLVATLLSHLVLGYVALVSLVLFTLLLALGQRAQGTNAWRRGKRLGMLLVPVALVTAYFTVPFLLDSPYRNRSIWEEPGKYNAYGAAWTLGTLIRGELFDYGRFPSLTLLAGAGLACCLWRWHTARYRVPVVLALVWLLLYFGRPTWGALLDLLPLSRDLYLHRLIAGVHLGGIFLIGLGLALPWRLARARGDVRYLLVAAALTGLLLYPAYRERAAYLAENARWMVQSRDALAAEQQDIAALIETLRHLPPGRVYAGRPGNWGGDYRVGAVPLYALLNQAGLDTLGYLYPLC